MKFVVTSDYDENTKMYPGMVITYKITPLFGIKIVDNRAGIKEIGCHIGSTAIFKQNF